jgi:hypothetical protein
MVTQPRRRMPARSTSRHHALISNRMRLYEADTMAKSLATLLPCGMQEGALAMPWSGSGGVQVRRQSPGESHIHSPTAGHAHQRNAPVMPPIHQI